MVTRQIHDLKIVGSIPTFGNVGFGKFLDTK